MRNIVEIIGWIIVGSLVVLVVTHPSGAARVIGSASNAVVSESLVLSGSGNRVNVAA